MKRIFKYFDEVKIGKSSKRIESKINKTVKLVTEHIDEFKYNLAILELRNLFDYMEKEVSKSVLETFLKLWHQEYQLAQH